MQTIREIRVTEGMLRESGALPTKLSITWQVRFSLERFAKRLRDTSSGMYASTPKQVQYSVSNLSSVLSVYPS